MSGHLYAGAGAAGSRAEADGRSASSEGGPRVGKEDEVIDVEFEEKR